MVIAQARARSGDMALQNGLDQLGAYYASRYTGAELRFGASRRGPEDRVDIGRPWPGR